MEAGAVTLSGTGTLAPMPLLEVDTSIKGTIIYTVRLAIKGEKGNGFVVTALITKPTTTGRRMLLSESTTSGFAVGKITGTSIKF